jgi:hypothetical protein
MARRTLVLAAVAVLAAPALALGGCVRWSTVTPLDRGVDPADLEPSRAKMLVLDEPQSGEIVCEEGFCQQWYRLDVPRPGTLRIEATTTAADPPMARIVLHDGLGNVLARANNQDGSALAIAQPVEGNVAAILVSWCSRGRDASPTRCRPGSTRRAS